MRKLYLLSSLLVLGAITYAQNANISYEVRVNSAGVRSTEGSTTSGSSCWESGDEEYTANVRIDGPTTGTNFCLQCNTNGDCNYGGGTVLRTSTNVATTAFTVVYDMFEDDGGARCTFDSGDDCRAVGSYSLGLIDNYPTATNAYNIYNDRQVYNAGSSEHRIRLDYSWRYAGTASAITPACAAQTFTQSSGGIRSHAVYLTAGATYQFETSTGPDTYLRLYGTDGYTIVAFDDDSRGGLLSLFTYAPSVSGWYYIETAMYLSGNSRSPLNANATLMYRIVEKTGATISNYLDAGAVSCNAYSNTQNNTAGLGFCNDIGQSSDDIYYRFTTAHTGYIDISHCSSNFDTYMHLLNSGGGSLAVNDDNGPLCAGNRASMRQLLNAGTYFVVGEGYSGNSGTLTTVIQAHTPTGGTIAGNTIVCPGESVAYSISGVSAATNYTWGVPSGATITAGQGTSSITVTFGSTGGNVSCVPKNFGDQCVGTTVNYGVTMQVSSTSPGAIGGTFSVCPGGSTVLTASGGTAGTGAGFQWFAGSCGSTVIGTGASITVTPGTATTYFVRRTGTCNTTGCISQTVTVDSESTSPGAIGGTFSVCPGGSTVLTASGGTAGTGAGFQWFAGSCGSTVIGTGASITVTPVTATTYFVRRTGTCNTTGCISQTVNITLANTWTGNAGSGGTGYWDVPGNWSCGSVPTNSQDVLIPGGAPNQPVIRNKATYGVARCNSINVQNGANVTIQPSGELRTND